MPLSTEYASVRFSETSFSVPAGGKRTVGVSITAPKVADPSTYPVFSGFINIASATAGESVQVSYLGLVGSLKDKQVVDNTDGYFGIKLPALLNNAGDAQVNTTNYTFVGADFPTLLFRYVTSLLRMNSAALTQKCRRQFGLRYTGA